MELEQEKWNEKKSKNWMQLYNIKAKRQEIKEELDFSTTTATLIINNGLKPIFIFVPFLSYCYRFFG